MYISTDQNLPRPHTSQVGKFALSGCKLGRGLCADVVEGRICWISTNTICRLGSDECSVWETTHFAYIRTSGIAKICRTYLVFSNNYWWVANICYFSPEQCINYGTETTGHTHVRPETLCSKLHQFIFHLNIKTRKKETFKLCLTPPRVLSSIDIHWSWEINPALFHKPRFLL